jgi:hypothetical protein
MRSEVVLDQASLWYLGHNRYCRYRQEWKCRAHLSHTLRLRWNSIDAADDRPSPVLWLARTYRVIYESGSLMGYKTGGGGLSR